MASQGAGRLLAVWHHLKSEASIQFSAPQHLSGLLSWINVDDRRALTGLSSEGAQPLARQVWELSLKCSKKSEMEQSDLHCCYERKKLESKIHVKVI